MPTLRTVSALVMATVSAAAVAADLPTTKTPPTPAGAVASCASPSDFFLTPCPLTYAGITLYGTVDAGVGYETFGAPWNRIYTPGNDFLIGKPGRKNIWDLSPNGLGQSNIGVKVKEEFAPGWSFVAQAETGFDPYSLQIANGPGAQRMNNNLPLALQSSNGDSSRAGQWFNSQLFAGVSDTAFGTLTFGRQNSLTLDGVNAYDPMSGSNAFSVIGFSGTTAGAGDTQATRSNSAVKYRLAYGSFRAAAIAQVGGYEQGNGASGFYQIQIGGDMSNLSLDAIYSRVDNVVSLGTYNGLPPADVPLDALKATISNNESVMLLAKYTWNNLKLYGGYEHIRFSNPSASYAVAGSIFTAIDGGPAVNQGNNFFTDKVLHIMWTGARYSVTPDLDAAVAYYHYIQDAYKQTSAANPACSNSSHGYCSGTLDAASTMVDWRFAKKFDAYAGLMWSQVSNGLANGYQAGGHVNVDPTVGLRFRF